MVWDAVTNNYWRQEMKKRKKTIVNYQCDVSWIYWIVCFFPQPFCVNRCSSFHVSRCSRCSAFLFLQLGTSADTKLGSWLAGCKKYLPSTLYGCCFTGNTSSEYLISCNWIKNSSNWDLATALSYFAALNGFETKKLFFSRKMNS